MKREQYEAIARVTQSERMCGTRHNIGMSPYEFVRMRRSKSPSFSPLWSCPRLR
jgi:hypothetical protein